MSFVNENVRALPFITIEESSGRFVIDQRAVEFIERISPPFGIVCVAGKYRTGKSTFLNRVLLNLPDGESGFSVGGTVQACTKGLWIYTELMGVTRADGSTMSVLVVDTEGLGAFSATATHDSKIFALALLVSSFFIYNSVGTIDEQAISNLSLVSNISKHVRARSDEAMALDGDNSGGGAGGGKGVSDARELGQLFPHFLWLIRDFSLELRDERGHALTENEYLENALADKVTHHHQDDSGDDAIENSDKNRLRSLLRAYFPHRACATLVRPCANESDLQRVDQMPASQLRSEFRSAAKKLRAHILRSVPVKVIDGRAVSGRGLVCLSQSYVTALNSGAAPVIRDSWALLAEIQFRDALESSEQTFRTAVDKESSENAVACRRLDTILENAADAAFLHFDHVAAEREGTVYDNFQTRLHQKLVELAKEARNSNLSQLEELAQQLAAPLFSAENASCFLARLSEQTGIYCAKIGLQGESSIFCSGGAASAKRARFDADIAIWHHTVEPALLDALKRTVEKEIQLLDELEPLKELASKAHMQGELEKKIFRLEEQLVTESQQKDAELDALQFQSATKLAELSAQLQQMRDENESLQTQCAESVALTDALEEANRLRDQISLLEVESSQAQTRANAMQSDFQAQISALRTEMQSLADKVRAAHEVTVSELRLQSENERAASANLQQSLLATQKQLLDCEERYRLQKEKLEKLKEQLQTERADQRKKHDEIYESARKEVAAQHSAQLDLLRAKAAAEAQVERLSERVATLSEKLDQKKPNVEAERAIALMLRSDADLKETRGVLFDSQRLLEEEKQKCRNLERQLRDQALDHEVAKMRLEMQYQVESARAISSSSSSNGVSTSVAAGAASAYMKPNASILEPILAKRDASKFSLNSSNVESTRGILKKTRII